MPPANAALAQDAHEAGETGDAEAAHDGVLRNGIAMRYARALQQGDYDEAIRMTLWMQDRLRYVRMGSDEPETVEAARRELKRSLARRALEDNHLRAEGVEDQYVFAPGARLELIRVEEGRDDLERPAKECAWIRVTYPGASNALRDETGVPIRSLAVGVNVSADGYILKSGIIGNLEVDRDSIAYDWASLQGG